MLNKCLVGMIASVPQGAILVTQGVADCWPHWEGEMTENVDEWMGM